MSYQINPSDPHYEHLLKWYTRKQQTKWGPARLATVEKWEDPVPHYVGCCSECGADHHLMFEMELTLFHTHRAVCPVTGCYIRIFTDPDFYKRAS